MVMNAMFFLWRGSGDKQGALSGLGEIVNLSFLELLSHRIPVSKVLTKIVY